ncbi:MAG: RNA-binding protein [Anaerolineae bacterium]
MEVKLYVGNLAQGTTEDDLRTLFAKAGGVASVALVKDRVTGSSKGFAFVGMHTQREAQKAISMLNTFDLNGYRLKVSLARPRPDHYSSGFGQRDRNKRR